MTDTDIIKAMEDCTSNTPPCTNCKYDGDSTTCDECMGRLMKDALDLINRFKAENKRLQKFKSYFDSLYGIGLDVEGWHENGNTISFDEFYDSAIEDMEGETE